MVEGLESDKIKAEKGALVGSANKAEFTFLKAFNFSKDLYKQHKFDGAGSSAELMKRLDTAISSMES